MYLEIIGFISLFAVALFTLSEVKKRRIFGVFGGLILIILGLMVIADGIEIKVGELYSMNETQTNNLLYNGTMGSVGLLESTMVDNYTNTSSFTNYNETGTGTVGVLRTQTVTSTYSSVQLSALPADLDINIIVGLFMLIIGLFTCYTYGLGI